MHTDKRALYQMAATILSGLMAKGSYYTGDPKVAAAAAWDYTEALINERDRRIEARIERSRQKERERYKAEHPQDPDDSHPASP
jgi:hypothetical protein